MLASQRISQTPFDLDRQEPASLQSTPGVSSQTSIQRDLTPEAVDRTVNDSLGSRVSGLNTQNQTLKSESNQESEELATPTWNDEEVEKIINRLALTEDKPKVTSALLGMLGAARRGTQRPNPHQPPLRDDIRDGDIIPKSDLLQHSDDGFHLDDLINHLDTDPIYRDLSKPVGSSEHLLVDVHGSDSLRTKIRKVLDKYEKIFSTTLPAQPARVTPLQLDINVREWETPKNQAPHRRQSTSKDEEIKNQTQVMLESRVIKQSTKASAWSQVLLTLKPNGK